MEKRKEKVTSVQNAKKYDYYEYSLQRNGNCKTSSYYGCFGDTEKELTLNPFGAMKWSCSECTDETEGT